MIHEYPYSIKRHGTTLEKCEDEPVQTPGCIQSFGVLLVLRTNDLTILQVSENSHRWLGLFPQELLSQNVAFAVGESLSQKIRSALSAKRTEKAPRYLATLREGEKGNTVSLHVSLHTCSGLALLELEDAGTRTPKGPEAPARAEPDYYELVRETLTLFQEAGSLRELSQFIAEEVHRITELDRVMVYRFHADESGEIVAEAKREDQGSWFGWRYPAHDIPKPARDIFKKIWSRPVPDVRSELFEMVPLLNPDTQKPLDMTYCSLRGASVMYTEYLDNMGVRAALTLPLMRDGELWGLVACQVTRFIGTVQDITASKEALEMQKELTQRAQAAEKAKSEFLAIMSHEIRTPLNGVIGMTNILADTELNEMQRDCVGTVLSSGESLLSVINDILDYSKIEAGRLQMETRSFSLRTCIEEVLDLFAVQIRNKGLEVVYLIASEIPDVSGDEVRLRQILVNLVGNAIKFTTKGEITQDKKGKITLKVVI